MTGRAVAPVVGVAMLVLVVVVLGVAVAALFSGDIAGGTTAPIISVEADAAADRLELRHEGGPPIELATVDIEITVDGTPLRHQPDVPTWGQVGFARFGGIFFAGGSDGVWRTGQTGTIVIASTTNDPLLDANGAVTVVIVEDDRVIARATATAL